MRKRRYTSPDGIDWRDPEMPVVRKVIYPFGRIELELVTPERETAWAQENIAQAFHQSAPHWSNDPTYTMRKYKRRRRKK